MNIQETLTKITTQFKKDEAFINDTDNGYIIYGNTKANSLVMFNVEIEPELTITRHDEINCFEQIRGSRMMTPKEAIQIVLESINKKADIKTIDMDIEKTHLFAKQGKMYYAVLYVHESLGELKMVYQVSENMKEVVNNTIYSVDLVRFITMISELETEFTYKEIHDQIIHMTNKQLEEELKG